MDSPGPDTFRRYLLDTGWSEISPRGNALRFVLDTCRGTVEVEIPNRVSFDDYDRRVSEALAILALVEHRSVADLIAGLDVLDKIGLC